MPSRILIVEDDPLLRLVIRDNLESEGYLVDMCSDGASAGKHVRTNASDLIILDLTLPDCDGLDLFPIIRLRGQIPIIILTARTQLAERLKGLRLGADDYITKPFEPEELLARVRAVLRRTKPIVSRISLGAVTVDFLNKQVMRGNRSISLTHREFELLSYLAEHRDIVIHRDELLKAVWGYPDTDIFTRTVDYAISRLRKKIEPDNRHPKFICTAHGDGYCLRGISTKE